MAEPSDPGMTTDELIDRLQARAADPARRVDMPQTEFGSSIGSVELGGMAGMLGILTEDLARVVRANRAGQPLDPDLVQRAEALEASTMAPVRTALPGVADAATLDRAEAVLDRPLPNSFRRIYGEVADGGFGPGPGLFAIDTIIATYRGLLADSPAPVGLAWPPDMVPLVDIDPGFYCLRLPAGRIVDWDPQETSERQDAKGWTRSFREIAPDIETWLGAWVAAPTPAEERENENARLHREELRRTRERIAAMTPQEREAVGLPGQDWEAAFIDQEDL